MKRPFSISFAVLLLLFAAGCASSSGSSATAVATATPEPTETPASSDGAAPSFEPGAGDLAAVLPTEVGGMALEYHSAAGEDVIGQDLDAETQAFFDRVGASPSDLTSAIGVGVDQEAGTYVSVAAFRVAGADEGTLREEFLATMEGQGDTGQDATVAGKSVTAFGDPAAPDGYLYVKGDIVFVVGAVPADLAAEAIAQLP